MDSSRKLLHEVHERSVWQVLVVYLVGGWAAYQIVLGVWEGIGLPDWVPPTALTLIIAGLPLVVATAMVQKGGPIRAASEKAPVTTEAGQIEPHPRLRVDDASGSSLTRKLSTLLTWRSVLVIGLGAVLSLGLATAGYMGMRTAGIGPVGTLLAKGSVERTDELLIARFDSPADEVLGETAAQLLRTAFDMSHLLRLPDQEAVADALERMDLDRSTPTSAEAQELAVREGWELVVTGEIQQIGDGYVITTRLIETATDNVLGRFSATARHAEDFVDAMNEIADAIHERIGASYRSIRQARRLARVRTSSLEALKAYTEAVWLREYQGNSEEAIPLLERAIAIDSTFGAAYRQLAGILDGRGGEKERELETRKLANRYRHRMTPFEGFQAEAQALQLRSPEAALTYYADIVQLYEQYVRANPEDPRPLINLGHYYYRLGRYEDAIAATERALEYYDDSALVWYNLTLAHMHAGHLDQAERALEQVNPGSDWHAEGTGHLAMARGEPRRAHDIWHERGVGPFWVLLTDLALGRFSEAEKHLQQRTDQLAPSAVPPVVLRWRSAMAIARALILPEDHAEARRRLVRALHELPIDSVPAPARPYLRLATAFAIVGDAARARRYLESGLERRPTLRLLPEGMVPRGMILLTEDRTEEAIATFQAADRGAPGAESDVLGPLARAYLAAGQIDSAMGAYERLLASPQGQHGYPPWGWLLHRPLAHRALARIYDERGETERATRHYARLIEWWRDADPEVQPQVAEAERRLSKLRPD